MLHSSSAWGACQGVLKSKQGKAPAAPRNPLQALFINFELTQRKHLRTTAPGGSGDRGLSPLSLCVPAGESEENGKGPRKKESDVHQRFSVRPEFKKDQGAV